MAAHVRRFRSASRSPRRLTSWANGPSTAADGSPQGSIGASTTVLAGTAVTALVDGLTIVRLRGELLIWLTTTAAASEGFNGAFGIAVANNDAVAAGVGSVMTPITNENWDGWMFHRYWNVFSGGVISGGVSADQDMINATSAVLRLEVDSKAMRKFPASDNLYACIETVESGTCAMNWSFNSRMLVKLA